MLEDQVAYLLQRYLGNYVRGLSKEALKISVWKGDVELTNMQLKPEALNALKLPVKVKAGFLGSVKIKVPWSRLGQDPVLVYLDRIFLLAEPETEVEGFSEDALQEAKRTRVKEMEMKLLEKAEHLKTEVNKSWLGSLVNTIIGNLKLSISNIHIRYEDNESNPGHPFAAGVTLERLSAVTVDDEGKETFATGGALDRIQKSAVLESLAVYFDSDISPWRLDKSWADLLPSEWSQVFKFGSKDGKPAVSVVHKHSYILQPVTGDANYLKLRQDESAHGGQPLQKATINLDNVTICLSKDGYRDMMKLVDNFTSFNQRLKYAHYRPCVPVKADPRAWWKYAYKAISDQMRKASGKMPWEQVLRYARLRKKYISLYASLLKSDSSRAVIDDNESIDELDRELDIALIVQWRMVAHKFVEKSVESNLAKERAKPTWWSLGWGSQSSKDEGDALRFGEEEWDQLNKLMGYKEGDDEKLLDVRKDVITTSFEVFMRHNASRLVDAGECIVELSCEGLTCSGNLYSEAKVFDMKLGSYCLTSPSGLLAESASAHDSLVGKFWYKPFDVAVDWSIVAKASPCYMTYLKDPVNEVVRFFESNRDISHKIALETAAAVQMTIDGVKRSAQHQMSRALKDQARFLLDLDIAAPKITIPTDFCPDDIHSTKLMLDLGNLIIRTKDEHGLDLTNERNLYLQFDLVLSDVSAFLVDGDYDWSKALRNTSRPRGSNFLPVIDKCGVVLNLQQLRSENPSYPATRLAVRVPSLSFHFSPARYHRLMQVTKIFQEDTENFEPLCPWNQADFEGWLSILTWKGVANTEAVWQRRYVSLVGPFLYVLEGPGARSYKQYLSLRGKQVCEVPPESVGDEENVLALCDAARSSNKVIEDANALILHCDSGDLRMNWQRRLQGAIYNASNTAPITILSETSSDAEDLEGETIEHDGGVDIRNVENLFITGVLDELKISFNYNKQTEPSLVKVLLSNESSLFEFRAIGGQVEISMKKNDMFIGTVLKSLEIEDLVCQGIPQRRFVARSFIRGPDVASVIEGTVNNAHDSGDLSGEGDDKFYEAPEDLSETVDSDVSLFKPPSFNKVPGLLPDGVFQSSSGDNTRINDLVSFVKAQIVIYDQNSPIYSDVDKRVIVTLATLSFYCRRPTILAVMDFVDAINIEPESSDAFSDSSVRVTPHHEISQEEGDDKGLSVTAVEPVVKGLLGKGKSRVIFCLTLNMARAQILLMKEDESMLATLSQDNFLTEIKVFPSSFSIKAAVGNLRISDDSLQSDHIYFWVCDMRNPGGSSFVELLFCSYSVNDDDYRGYDYSLVGQLSEVRVVYLNRFIQELVGYFTGLAPNTSRGVVKLNDQSTNTQRLFTADEIEGSPALRLDLSLNKPIILMPRKTSSLDYLKLDVVHITVQNTFCWCGGNKGDLSAVHLETLTIRVEDINLNVGTGTALGNSIIQDVNGVSIVIRRSLRDLFHQVPSMEATVEVKMLKAFLSNREYQIITECAQSNLSESANIVPPLRDDSKTSDDAVEPAGSAESVTIESELQVAAVWISMKVIFVIDLVELTLHSGFARDTPLATLQVSNVWLLYKSTSAAEDFLFATVKSINVIDDREGTEEQFRLAIGKPNSIDYGHLRCLTDDKNHEIENADPGEAPVVAPTMLIFDAKFSQALTSVSLCLQRPQLLVALDFLLAVAEFFVPTVRGLLASEEDEASMHLSDAVILNDSIYVQASSDFSLSPARPLVADDERFDHFIYDGNGGTLYLKDRQGAVLTSSSREAIIHVGNGKKLQFRNVTIKDGRFLDSCIVLGANSGYSVMEQDHVYLSGGDDGPSTHSVGGSTNPAETQSAQVDNTTQYVIELQVINPELTFYNSSKDVGESLVISNKLLHAELDAFCRIVLKGDTMEMTANALGLTMESNGIRILEPFDTSVSFSRVTGKTNIHFSVTDVFMNFSFSILRLFLAVEEDILAFLRTTSKEMTAICSEFDKVGVVKDVKNDQVYVFWRPRAPPGFVVLGDYLTPLDKPPTKRVLAVNKTLVKVKRPASFRMVWPLSLEEMPDVGASSEVASKVRIKSDVGCCVWFPVAPNGYVAMGCVVSSGRTPPPLTAAFCLSASLVSPCSLRDCIIMASNEKYPSTAFWRVDNSVGTFLPADLLPNFLGAYDLRHVFFGFSEVSGGSGSTEVQASLSGHHEMQSTNANSGRRLEAVASFSLVWWNQASNSRKKLSIWRPVISQGMVYFGDIAVKGYEPPSTCIVLQDAGHELFKAPLGFQRVGHVKKQRAMDTISFWLPQAPPGFVALGCIACKGTPKFDDFSTLRCIRSDQLTGAQISDESIWDTSDAKAKTDAFSIWTVGNELGTFLVRSGYRKPPKRSALKLADQSTKNGQDDTVIDAEISTFSAALFDDFGGLMVPLFNISLSGVGVSIHGRPETLSSRISFSLAARSYNDKYEAWEPVVEPVDGFLRYQYDLNSAGAPSQLRLTTTRDLNMNVSVSNVNMVLQAYASWNNLSQVHESYINKEAISPNTTGGSLIDIHHKKNFYIVPLNKLGQDIFIRATEIRGLPQIIKMPTGDMKPLKVPVSKNILDSHMRGNAVRKVRMMVTVTIAEAEFPRVEGLYSRQYAVAVRISPFPGSSEGAMLPQQSARTCGSKSELSSSTDFELVKWNEAFFFKVESPELYVVEVIVSDMGKGDPIGFFSASLKHIADEGRPYYRDCVNELKWMQLSSPESKNIESNSQEPHGKLKCAVLLSSRLDADRNKQSKVGDRKQGFIQISPKREGPWTSVRLNYSAPAACWRLGNDVVASEVTVKDGNRYVNIRSLVSVRNCTDFVLDLSLRPMALVESMMQIGHAGIHEESNGKSIETDENFETQKYDPGAGWVRYLDHTCKNLSDKSEVELPAGWEWVDDWHLDKRNELTDGWVYAPDIEKLTWPETCGPSDTGNGARKRRWIRNRRRKPMERKHYVTIGILEPGDTIPLPLTFLTQTGPYSLYLRPTNVDSCDEYSWSTVVEKPDASEDTGRSTKGPEMCVSSLEESEKLLYCAQSGGSSSSNSHGIWFYANVQAVEVSKDIHSNPIQDWTIVIKSPLCITNYLPLTAEYSFLEMQVGGHLAARSRGIFAPGKTVYVYSADIRKPLFFTLFPREGWQPIHEAVLISHPSGVPSRTLSLRSSISGRIVQIIVEQNHDNQRPFMPRSIRIYAPFWLAVARCPKLIFRLVESADKSALKLSVPFKSRKKKEEVFEEITEEELHEGCTIASALNFKMLGLSVSIAHSGEETFGPFKDLSPLGDMDGSIELPAYDAVGNSMRLFICSKPCPYPSIPTKVISVRPFMTFTNRLGEDLFVKFSTQDEPKILHASDSRVSFVYHETIGQNKLQVRLKDTKWCFPFEVMKEDSISLVLRGEDGSRRLLRTEIRGYEEGSRFIVVFRLGSIIGPIRLENRTTCKTISFRQCGFSDDFWIQLPPLFTTNFAWEDPYGEKILDIKIRSENMFMYSKLDFEAASPHSFEITGLQLHVLDAGDVKIARFIDEQASDGDSRSLLLYGNWGISRVQRQMQNTVSPVELIVELGVVGISIVDHRPKELSYLYLERVYISSSTGYDGGTTSRFKIIFGYLQLDNQLPLTLMPVLLAPEQNSDLQHPVFKMTLTMCNENNDGIQVYPYIYIRVTEHCWRLNIHEPIIWAVMDFCGNLQLDRVPQSSSVSQVDPEIRIDLIDVSEIRLKVSLETAPAQRPHGVLGIWSPILSAIGNAFKIQVHLRKVMHRDRFMRKSSVMPAITNRIWRDLIHNPLHLIFSVDVLGMTSSTLASLSKGFAELSTDGQFLQLRSKQVWSRKITGVGDGIIQGTEALAQGFAFGVSGVVTKPVESARQNGILGLAHGLGRAFVGFIVQPASGALDFLSLTVDGIGASCARCFEVLSNRSTLQRIRNPRAVHSDSILREYDEKEAAGQMVLHLAEASRLVGCTEIFKEPSKFAWSDYYEIHFVVPQKRIVLVSNKRIMLLQCQDLDRMDKKPSKIIWDVPWDELLALELVKAGSPQPLHLLLHLKTFRRSEVFARLIKCNSDEEPGSGQTQAMKLCAMVRKMWRAYQSDLRTLTLKVPSSQRHVCFSWTEAEMSDLPNQNKSFVVSRESSSSSSMADEKRFQGHSVNFRKIWSSELEFKGRCSLCRKKAPEEADICTIWRPTSPSGYVAIGDIARVGVHPPNVAAVYRYNEKQFAAPLGFDLVWRNCLDDYRTPVSIWLPRAPEGFVSLGCVAVASFAEPELDAVYCVAESIVEAADFEDGKVWSAPGSYPWACHIYQVQSLALHIVALRQPKEVSDWKPKKVIENQETSTHVS